MYIQIKHDINKENKFYFYLYNKTDYIDSFLKSLYSEKIQEEELEYDKEEILKQLEMGEGESFDGIIVNQNISIRGEELEYAYVNYIGGNLGFKGKLGEFIENYFSDINYSEFSEDVFEQIENLQDDINKIKEKVSDIEKEMLYIIITTLNGKIDFSEEDIKTIKENIETGGGASFELLQILGYTIEEDIEEEGFPKIIKNEEIKIENEEIGEIKELLRRMQIAGKRHKLTDYDNIDKSKMQEEEVKRIRMYYNSQIL